MHRFLLPAVIALASAGCSSRCDTNPWSSLEVGIGTRDFIYVPYDGEVWPDSPLGAEAPYYNVALRGWGLDRSGLDVHLEAWVGETRYAASDHEGVALRCRGRGRQEVGGLRLPLDPRDLPPPVEREVPVVIDTGWLYRDSGIWYEPESTGDVRIVATVTERSGRVTSTESYWHVYR
ncbi:MAG: hypothetical protein R3F61_21170 [Myxococcota bacterium]